MKPIPPFRILLIDTLCGLIVAAAIVAIMAGTLYLITHIYK
jgi:hypothetical protein